jgi:hypothetical protein
MEGTVASVPPQGGRKHPQQEFLQVDTTNMLFICGGAFSGLDKVISDRGRGTSIGFGANVIAPEDRRTGKILEECEPEDLVKFGLIPEFIGRLPVIATLEDLDEPALIQILTEPKNALLKQYQRLFEMENVTLTFTDDALSAVARRAIQRRASCSTPCSSCPTCAASRKWRSMPKSWKAARGRFTCMAPRGRPRRLLRLSRHHRSRNDSTGLPGMGVPGLARALSRPSCQNPVQYHASHAWVEQ